MLSRTWSGSLGLGIRFHVSFPAPVLIAPITANALGVTTVALPIPAAPIQAGVSFFDQIVWSWANDPCDPTTTDLSATPGLAITIQP